MRIPAAHRLLVPALVLLLGALGVMALSTPPAWAGCPACDEYIWEPPDPRGNSAGGSGANGASPGGSSGGDSAGGSSAISPGGGPLGTGTISGIGSAVRGALAGASGAGSGSGSGSSAGDAGTDREIGAEGPRTPGGGAGVLSAGTSAGGSPIGLLVLAAAALIGLVGLAVARRHRRRRAAS